VAGLGTDRREVLVTTLLDAEPDNRYESPGPTIAPLMTAAAVGVTFIGAVYSPWAALVGAGLLVPPLISWGWPKTRAREAPRAAAPRPIEETR
jgi:hypothetical protein